MKHILPMALMLWMTSTMADNGIIELNQACAEVGCIEGDSPGLPITIRKSGSYRLTSNIVQTNVDGSGLSLPNPLSDQAEHISIDLNGFTISGPVVCTGDIPTCTATGGTTSAGIWGTTSRSVFIHNGTITGFNNGVYLRSSSTDSSAPSSVASYTLTNLKITNSANEGVRLSGGGTGWGGNVGVDFAYGGSGMVRNVHVENSGGRGIVASGSPGLYGNFVVRDSTAINNQGVGILTGACSGNVMSSNADGTAGTQQSCDIQFNTNFCNGVACP